MEKIQINGILILELKSEQDWANKVPRHLPDKTRPAQSFLWVDKNGDVFERGLDFMEAEKKATYPCRVYKVQSVSDQFLKELE